MARPLRSLYLCYLSLDDPLVETQVVAYLEGLARCGHTIHLLTWETRRLARGERARIRERLAERGIAWHSLRYHKRPSLPATAFDMLCGIAYGLWLVHNDRLEAIHARSHVPAFAGILLRRLTGAALIFDIRGLLAEEYVDAGNWRPGSLPVRIVKWVERAAIARAAATVTLTERVAVDLFGPPPWRSHWVIPCCADVERIEAQASAREQVRARLGLGDRPVMVYVGKFGGWYLAREMVEFFAVARKALPGLHFLVLTQSDPGAVTAACERRDIPSDDYTVTRVPLAEIGSHLGAADLAISLIRPAPSKRSSSPTKIGEYLAAGLPIVCALGIGDMDPLFERYRVGVLLDELTPETYARAAGEAEALRCDPRTAERCREAARSALSLEAVGVPRYDELYRFVAESRSGLALKR